MSNLKRIRKSIPGMTIDKLSGKSGVSKGYISNLENSLKSNPTLSIASKLAGSLGVDIETIFPKDERFIK